MPTYEYECSNCGHRYELFQSIIEAPKKRCPQCKKNRARRLLGTGAGIIFKGSGFYATDYRSEGYKKAAKAETATSPALKDSGKPESKAEKKSTSASTS